MKPSFRQQGESKPQIKGTWPQGWLSAENSEGGGGGTIAKIFKGKYSAWSEIGNSRGEGWEGPNQKPFLGEVWMFFGTTQYSGTSI